MVETKDKTEKKDKANLQDAVTEAAEQIEEELTGGFTAGTTRVLDQAGPQVVMVPTEDTDEPVQDVVVVEERRIELQSIPDLVTNQAGQVLIYGPFDEYRIVNTDFGDYGVTLGNVLGFQIRDFFNKKESRIEKQAFPVYWKADTGKRVLGSGIDPADYRKPGRRV